MTKIIKCPKELLKNDLCGKNILITGGYSGIGLFTSKQLISQNATLIIAGKNKKKGNKISKEIGSDFFELDLSNRDSIENFSNEFKRKYKKLDILICNAALMAPPAPGKSQSSKRTKEGWEIQMATNYLGHVLLIHLLENIIKLTPNSRIINVSSCAADSMPSGGQKNQADIDLSDPYWNKRKYIPIDAYGQSKLAQILYSNELAKRLEGTDTKVVSIHPGWGSSTNLDRYYPFILRKIVIPIIGRFLGAITIEQASQIHLYCALSPDIENGKFYSQIGIYGNKNMQKGGLPMEFKSPNATLEKQSALWSWTMKELNL